MGAPKTHFILLISLIEFHADPKVKHSSSLLHRLLFTSNIKTKSCCSLDLDRYSLDIYSLMHWLNVVMLDIIGQQIRDRPLFLCKNQSNIFFSSPFSCQSYSLNNNKVHYLM